MITTGYRQKISMVICSMNYFYRVVILRKLKFNFQDQKLKNAKVKMKVGDPFEVVIKANAESIRRENRENKNQIRYKK